MANTKLIQKFDELIRQGKALLPIEGDDIEFCARRGKWELKCQVTLEKAFGNNSVYLKEFQSSNYAADVEYAITSEIAIMEEAKEEIASWEKTDNKLDKIKKEITEEKAEAERRAAVVETKLWGSVIELIDMQRKELRNRNKINQEILKIHKEIDEIKTLLSKIIFSKKAN